MICDDKSGDRYFKPETDFLSESMYSVRGQCTLNTKSVEKGDTVFGNIQIDCIRFHLIDQFLADAVISNFKR